MHFLQITIIDRILGSRHSMKIILKIDLGREPKILSIMVICKICIFASCNTSINIRIFRDFYDSEIKFSKKLFIDFFSRKNRVGPALNDF